MLSRAEADSETPERRTKNEDGRLEGGERSGLKEALQLARLNKIITVLRCVRHPRVLTQDGAIVYFLTAWRVF